ncbi:MAG: hypothetical protein WD850_02960 [Candidatus Spechtbacterales bacterium]
MVYDGTNYVPIEELEEDEQGAAEPSPGDQPPAEEGEADVAQDQQETPAQMRARIREEERERAERLQGSSGGGEPPRGQRPVVASNGGRRRGRLVLGWFLAIIGVAIAGILILGIALWLFGADSGADSGVYEFQVTNAEDETLAGAIVRASGGLLVVEQEKTTDEEGRVAFDLPLGEPLGEDEELAYLVSIVPPEGSGLQGTFWQLVWMGDEWECRADQNDPLSKCPVDGLLALAAAGDNGDENGAAAAEAAEDGEPVLYRLEFADMPEGAEEAKFTVSIRPVDNKDKMVTEEFLCGPSVEDAAKTFNCRIVGSGGEAEFAIPPGLYKISVDSDEELIGSLSATFRFTPEGTVFSLVLDGEATLVDETEEDAVVFSLAPVDADDANRSVPGASGGAAERSRFIYAAGIDTPAEAALRLVDEGIIDSPAEVICTGPHTVVADEMQYRIGDREFIGERHPDGSAEVEAFECGLASGGKFYNGESVIHVMTLCANLLFEKGAPPPPVPKPTPPKEPFTLTVEVPDRFVACPPGSRHLIFGTGTRKFDGGVIRVTETEVRDNNWGSAVVNKALSARELAFRKAREVSIQQFLAGCTAQEPQALRYPMTKTCSAGVINTYGNSRQWTFQVLRNGVVIPAEAFTLQCGQHWSVPLVFNQSLQIREVSIPGIVGVNYSNCFLSASVVNTMLRSGVTKTCITHNFIKGFGGSPPQGTAPSPSQFIRTMTAELPVVLYCLNGKQATDKALGTETRTGGTVAAAEEAALAAATVEAQGNRAGVLKRMQSNSDELCGEATPAAPPWDPQNPPRDPNPPPTVQPTPVVEVDDSDSTSTEPVYDSVLSATDPVQDVGPAPRATPEPEATQNPDSQNDLEDDGRPEEEAPSSH